MIFNNLSDLKTVATNYGFQLEKGYESDITSYYVNYENRSVARVWMHTKMQQYKISYDEPIKDFEYIEWCYKDRFEEFLRTVIKVKKKAKLRDKLAAIKKDFR